MIDSICQTQLPHTWIVTFVLTMEKVVNKDDINFPIVKFPLLSSNIPPALHTEFMSLG